MLPVAMLKRLTQGKPRAKLRITRKQYEGRQPWMVAGMNRKKFEEIIVELPDETIDALYCDAEPARLVEAIFGKVD